MDKKETEKLFQWMQEFAVTAGAIALRYRGKVTNKGKETYNLASGKESAGGNAKTEVDEMIQELFLAELYQRWPEARINVEEDTPLVSLFKTGNNTPRKSSLTVHLDPIDGTLTYVTGKKDFAIGLAISDAKHSFTHTVIYAPVSKKLFIASPAHASVSINSRKLSLKFIKNSSRIIYEKRLLSPQGRSAIKSLGFSFAPLQSCHLAITDISLGQASAFLYGGSNPHDGMIPSAFARRFGVIPYTAKGFPLDTKNLIVTRDHQFLSFARIPSLCYYSCTKKIKNSIQTILSQKKNLHEEYLARFAHKEK